MTGLYQLQRDAARRACQCRQAAAAETKPADAHYQSTAAITAERESAELAARIAAIEEFRIECAALTKLMSALPPSENLTLARQRIEDAEARLVRELGNP